ncbi:hypothetical protein E7811_12175 [Aliigemmobacter aestuarii]|uniref:SMI1/KNR4 family protein n=1 Tax=Aliigemmobacter aestuarii TaxID=1445661 RepID=A0A4S3MM76_9RHOB|nr:hypothetical protein [Gemmobacter aestuarii]THD82902.1 hypothetical protein E7811_12175 [Gemmobacter aestuarii]
MAEGMANGAGQGFADEIAAAMPATMTLPGDLRAAFDWMDSVGAVQAYANPRAGGPKRFATLYPADSGVDPDRQSRVMFEVLDDFYYDYPNLSPAKIRERLFLFARTGDDGSQAGLWLDDRGRIHLVHLGSGSGSTWFARITDSPLSFLRFLAIGYAEPGFDDGHSLTAEENWLQANGLTGQDRASLETAGLWQPTVPPFAFQDFLKQRFGTTTPDRATDAILTPDGDPEAEPDDFALWLLQITG